MRAIKSISKLENRVSNVLWNRGIRFRKNSILFGKPDISIQKYKIVIFIDSCFWHVCPLHGNKPKSNQEYWIKKLERNQYRDKEVNDYYNKNGWYLLRFWEHDLKEDFEGTVDRISLFIKQVKGEEQ
ncbi:DNA mismatch endonuclease, patch repair protein Vsr [Neobacillus bataviensis LMG 21833]|uniref:DNA mismatch endonuclease, patch repair protein Vsr n=1 Tax=Neobacillus bataviensis LMG 21833 TaxID=1117379 RepID=K6D9S9_9BACI|nr:very short patch repair endonuclease [Neobacillus bataviensis]EKN69292.1 DNA mismatch endonuclease, patch repair protein Vsr [Neobacillus bataviensis LMG 21833]